jgi:spore coat protein U-like protein
MKSARFVLLLGFLVLNLSAMPLFAATSTASFSVTATVQATCQVSTTAQASKADTAAWMANASSNVSVTCTSPTPYSVHYRSGSTAGASSAQPDYVLSPDSSSGAHADSATVTITY